MTTIGGSLGFKATRSQPRRDWLKVKCVQTGTFVIIGYQPGFGAVRVPIANLKVATFDGTRLRYAGTIGTGFSDLVGKSPRERLDRIQTPRCIVTGLKAKGAVWVEPELQAEVAFRGRTGSGELRAASFKGLAEGAVPT